LDLSNYPFGNIFYSDFLYFAPQQYTQYIVVYMLYEPQYIVV